MSQNFAATREPGCASFQRSTELSISGFVLGEQFLQKVGEALSNLSKRIGFRLAPGLSERVIYRELFPAGLTLLDLTESGSNVSFTMSHVAARQELRDLVILLQIPELAGIEIAF